MACWNIPLSPKVSPLVLTPGWVPLLSQMVKRTLIDPSRVAADGRQSPFRSESDLTRLTDIERKSLSESGWHFSSAEQIVGDIAKLPSKRHDWTAVCLLLCLCAALLEIGVCNYV